MKQGFTLLELLMVISLFGILIALASPSYFSAQYKSRRVDAETSLLQEKIALARCYLEKHAYQGACVSPGHFPHPSLQGYYRIDLVSSDKETFLLSARPRGAQVHDRLCQVFEINQANQKSARNAQGLLALDCWEG